MVTKFGQLVRGNQTQSSGVGSFEIVNATIPKKLL